jgi:hypothetical protein
LLDGKITVQLNLNALLLENGTMLDNKRYFQEIKVLMLPMDPRRISGRKLYA